MEADNNYEQNTKLTIGRLSQELNLYFERLRLPIKRLRKTSIGLSLEPKEEIAAADDYFGIDHVLPKTLYQFIKKQNSDSKKLVTLDVIAENNHISKRDFKHFVKNVMDRNERYQFLQPNIFIKSKSDAVKKSREDKIVDQYLKYKISFNTVVSAKVPQVRVRTGKNTGFAEYIEVHLLEAVRTSTWKQGQVVGFYKRTKSVYYPIVSLYNRTLKVETKIRLDPKSRGVLSINKRHSDKQPVIWSFAVNDLLSKNNESHKYNYLINMILSTVNKNHLGCSYRSRGDYNDPYIEMITDGITIDITDFQLKPEDNKKLREDKQHVYGDPKSVEKIKKLITESTNDVGCRITVDENKITIRGRYKKVSIAWIPEMSNEVMKAYEKIEAETGTPVDLLMGEAIVRDYRLMNGAIELSEDKDLITHDLVSEIGRATDWK